MTEAYNVVGISGFCGQVGATVAVGSHRITLEFTSGQVCNFAPWELEKIQARNGREHASTSCTSTLCPGGDDE